MATPAGVIKKSFAHPTRGVSRDISRTPRVEATSASDARVQELRAQGYTQEGNELRAPEQEYTSYQDRSGWKTTASYSPHVVELDAGGRIVKETYYAPKVEGRSSTGGWIEYKVKATSTKTYDEGTVTTTVEDTSPSADFLTTGQQVEGEIKRGERTAEPKIVTERRQAQAVAIGGSSGGAFPTGTGKIGYATGGVQQIKTDEQQIYRQETETYRPVQQQRLKATTTIKQQDLPYIDISRISPGRETRYSDQKVLISTGAYLKLRGEDPSRMSYANKGAVVGYKKLQYVPQGDVYGVTTVVDDSGRDLLLGSPDMVLSKQEEKTYLERQIDRSARWEEGITRRSQRTADFFSETIKASPFRTSEVDTRGWSYAGLLTPGLGGFATTYMAYKTVQAYNEPVGKTKPLNFGEQVGAYGMATPALLTVAFPEVLGSAAYKTFITNVALSQGSNTFFGLFSDKSLPSQATREATKTELVSAAKRVPGELKTAFDITTPIGLVNVASVIAAPSFFGKATTSFKGAYVRFGATRVPPEMIFAESVLKGKETLPTSKSVQDTITRFRATRTSDADVYGATASPEPLGGTVAGVGKKAASGFEDPGIYVTPAGEASPYFLRIAKADVATPSKVSYSFNPLKGLLAVPTVTEFAARGIVRLPRDVISQRGFKQIKTYQEEVLAGRGVLQMTKRSEIGLGGTRAKGRGTRELEAVVPVGQEFFYESSTFLGRLKGFDLYTEFRGEPVAIRETSLLTTESSLPPGGRIVSASQIREGAILVSELSKPQVVVRPGGGFYSQLLSQSVVPIDYGSLSAVSSSSVSRVVKSSVVSSSYLEGLSYVSGSSYFSYPSYVASSSYSIQPSYPSYPSYPRRPSYPSYPSYPSHPSYPSYPSYPRVPSTRTLAPPHPPKRPPRLEDPYQKNQAVYDVYVRESKPKGKSRIIETKVNEEPLARNAAINKGVYYTDNTSARTFRIVPRGTKETSDEPMQVGMYKFRPRKTKSKIRPKVWIEKSTYLIDTPGEQREITAKGLKTLERQRRRIF